MCDEELLSTLSAIAFIKVLILCVVLCGCLRWAAAKTKGGGK